MFLLLTHTDNTISGVDCIENWVKWNDRYTEYTQIIIIVPINNCNLIDEIKCFLSREKETNANKINTLTKLFYQDKSYFYNDDKSEVKQWIAIKLYVKNVYLWRSSISGIFSK